jgi:hypothetical protein
VLAVLAVAAVAALLLVAVAVACWEALAKPQVAAVVAAAVELEALFLD